MKKILAIVLSVITLSLCLTGCVYEDLSVKLNKDETGSIAATIGLKKDFVDKMMNGQDPFDGKETKEIEYDGEKYIAYTEVTDYVSFDEIAKALSEMTYDIFFPRVHGFICGHVSLESSRLAFKRKTGLEQI